MSDGSTRFLAARSAAIAVAVRALRAFRLSVLGLSLSAFRLRAFRLRAFRLRAFRLSAFRLSAFSLSVVGLSVVGFGCGGPARLADRPAVTAAERPCRDDALPDFPWPVPPPSARMALPKAWLATVRDKPDASLRDVADALDAVFLSAGYSQRAYFRLQAQAQTLGFALVTRMERIRDDGTPFPAQQRFVPAGAEDRFDIVSFLRSLFVAPVGFYRVIVLVVARAPIEASGESLTESAAAALLEDGGSRLVGCVAGYPFSREYAADALIYEFRHAPEETPADDNGVTQLKPGKLDPGLHLRNAGLLPPALLRR